MKESIGMVSITAIVIVFILFFTGYMCISLNQAKAYNVKNEIISIIQKNNGLNDTAKSEISTYMAEVGYRSSGTCDEGYSLMQLDGTVTDSGTTKNNTAAICIKKYYINGTNSKGLDDNLNDPENQIPSYAYYNVQVFFAFDMPIINSVFPFSLKGSTRSIFCPSEDGGDGCHSI